jgi:phosphoribosylanthranilate isomerase
MIHLQRGKGKRSAFVRVVNTTIHKMERIVHRQRFIGIPLPPFGVFYNKRMPCGVKICGVTSVADAVAAAKLGADVIGLNFYKNSPRCIDEATALEIVKELPTDVDAYILAVDEPWTVSLDRAKRLGFAPWIQVHRAEHVVCPDRNQFWMPAFSVKDEASLQSIEEFLNRCRQEGEWAPTAVLVDAHVPGSFGGTGQTAPWEILAEWTQAKNNINVFLAGGLTPDNVAQAIRTVRPHMVDVASGVECSPGKKDIEKMRRFIDVVRSL